MGQCEYVNNEKSGPWNGWYCNIAKESVERSLHQNYCNSSVACKYCPLRGGDDRYRKQSRPDPTPPPKTSSYTSDSSYSGESSYSGGSTSYSGGGGGGGFGCLDRFFFGLIGVVLGGFLLLLLGSVLLSSLGFFREDATLNLSVPSGVNPRQFTMQVISHNPKKDYKVTSDSVTKDGTAEIRMHVGMNSAYLIFDNQKFSLSDHALNGETSATLDVNYDQVQDKLCRIVWVDMQVAEGGTVPTDDVAVLDKNGAPMLWMPTEEGRIMVVIPERWTGNTVTLAINGYEPVTISVRSQERLTGVSVQLKLAN